MGEGDIIQTSHKANTICAISRNSPDPNLFWTDDRALDSSEISQLYHECGYGNLLAKNLTNISVTPNKNGALDFVENIELNIPAVLTESFIIKLSFW